MMKLQIQLHAVLTLLPRCRSFSGRISLGYTQTVAWKPMVNARIETSIHNATLRELPIRPSDVDLPPWKINSMAAAPIPACVFMLGTFSTAYIKPVWVAMTPAIRATMDKRGGLRPMRSIRNPARVVSIGKPQKVVSRLTRNETRHKKPGVQNA